MSPIAMALLGLVAYKAIKQLSPSNKAPRPPIAAHRLQAGLPVEASADCFRVPWAASLPAAPPAAC